MRRAARASGSWISPSSTHRPGVSPRPARSPHTSWRRGPISPSRRGREHRSAATPNSSPPRSPRCAQSTCQSEQHSEKRFQPVALVRRQIADQVVDDVEQRPRLQRLGDVAVGTALVAVQNLFVGGLRRPQPDRRAGVPPAAALLERLQAVETRHHHVEDQQVDAGARAQDRQRCGAVARRHDLIAARGNELGGEVAQRFLVIDHQHGLVLARHSTASSSACDSPHHARRPVDLVDRNFRDVRENPPPRIVSAIGRLRFARPRRRGVAPSSTLRQRIADDRGDRGRSNTIRNMFSICSRCAVIWHSPCLLLDAAMPSFRRSDAGRAADKLNLMSTPLRGLRLRVAWGVWAAAALCGVALLIGLAPARMVQLRGLASDNASGLAALGLSQQAFLDYLAGLDLTLFLIFAAAGITIFVRKPDTWLTIMVSANLIVHGAAMTRPEDSFALASADWRWFALAVACAVTITSITGLVLLPDGRFVPRYTRPLTAFWAVAIVVRYVFLPQFARPDGRPTAGVLDPGPWVSLLILLLAIGGFITG